MAMHVQTEGEKSVFSLANFEIFANLVRVKNIVYVLVTCKLKMYLTDSNKENVETTIFQTLKALTRSQWSDMAEIRTHPSFNACSFHLKVSNRLE